MLTREGSVQLLAEVICEFTQSSSLKRPIGYATALAGEPDFADRRFPHFVRRIKRAEVVRSPDPLVEFREKQ